MSSTSPESAPTVGSASDDRDAGALRALADRVETGNTTAGAAPPAAEVAGALRRAATDLEQTRRQAEAALASALRWKERAVASWADSSRGAAADRAELVDLREHAHELSTEIAAIQRTLSWRVTAPLRGVRRLRPRGSR